MFSTVVYKDYVKSMFYRVSHSGNNHMDEVRFLNWISTFLFHEDEFYKFVQMFRLYFLLNLILTRGPAESWRDLFDYFNIDYFKIVLKFQVSQVDSALPTQKKWKRSLCIHW